MHGCLLEMKVICFLEIKAMIHMYELIIHLWKRSAEKILLAEVFACYQKLVITVCFTVISLLMEIKNCGKEKVDTFDTYRTMPSPLNYQLMVTSQNYVRCSGLCFNLFFFLILNIICVMVIYLNLYTPSSIFGHCKEWFF